ncbi:SAM-dependent chlorinase/fluorinase [Rhodoferax sp. 4810]|uniref:SAM-dependent chlorinase/fluorinase n=1 Tax=Thiospirillum jenense TaxID=1653858 RepID=A0A839HNG6_9GAMM|nr:SAM-dependent chlorinase/fluorinase [Thiospirillum jenense]MBB1075827.1 SAM-dependent chlorinase/fluorinase [Rhodoferax jenense]MBB1126902.1 SAM-dependent chlorinase/fluorinase [Thiospirillum jenense]
MIPERIALMTDFGNGPYVGQVRLRLAELLPTTPVLDLIADLPPFRPDLAAYLLPGLVRGMPPGTLYLGVVDPGVGGERAALAITLDDNWLIGPDNGLFAPLIRQAHLVSVQRVDWRPANCSDSFHGRDLFAPLAAALIHGTMPMPAVPLPASAVIGYHGPMQLPRVVYVDHYGNLMTGLSANVCDQRGRLRIGSHTLTYARTFCSVPVGQAFWYHNAFGLVEIAVNQGRAATLFSAEPGTEVHWLGSE